MELKSHRASRCLNYIEKSRSLLSFCLLRARREVETSSNMSHCGHAGTECPKTYCGTIIGVAPRSCSPLQTSRWFDRNLDHKRAEIQTAASYAGRLTSSPHEDKRETRATKQDCGLAKATKSLPGVEKAKA